MTRTTVKRKNIALKEAKGYFGISKGIRKMQIQRLEKGWQYATNDRRKKRQIHKSIWIQRINAGAREHGLSYSKFIFGLKKQGVHLNRKMLSELATHEPFSFLSLISLAKKELNH